jgi:transcriptional regulator with XRE-family HTH domain
MSEVAVLSEGTLADLVRDVLLDDETATEYLVQAWLGSTAQSLQEARRRAGLTQADVAQKLGTKQPNIARLEKDAEGSISLHRYISYAVACGMMPLDVKLETLGNVRSYALHDPDAARSEILLNAWKTAQANSVVVPGNTVPSMGSQTIHASITGTISDVLKGLKAAFEPAKRLNNTFVPLKQNMDPGLGMSRYESATNYQQPWPQDSLGKSAQEGMAA